MPIVNRQRERLIVEQGRAQGKSDDFIKQAVIRSRQLTQQQTQQPINQGLENRKNLFKGFGKGALSTLKGAATLGEKIVGAPTRAIQRLTGQPVTQPDSVQRLQTKAEQRFGVGEGALTTPEGGFQKAGFLVEQVAEFLAPSTKIAKISKGQSLVKRAGIEAGTIGGQTALQQGEVGKEAKIAALVGALFPVAGAVIGATKRGLAKGIGEKIQTTVIRPTARDAKDGFKIANISKYNVGGTLEETVTKSHVKLNNLTEQLEKTLAKGEGKVNLGEVYDNTVLKLASQKGRQFGDVRSINRITDDLAQEIEEQVGSNLTTDLITATNIKRGAGTKGAWSFGNVDRDSSAIEKVYTTFYNQLKEEIERVAPKGIKEINKSISELIPISNAALRRLPVEQRNNVLSLTDSIGLFSAVFDPRALLLIGANRLSKNGKFAEYLLEAANRMKERGAVGKRIFGN